VKSIAAVMGAMLLVTVFPGARDQMKGRLVCQGEYSAVGKDPQGKAKVVKRDAWRMKVTPDGDYSIVVELVTPGPSSSLQERHIFTSAMKPKGFEMSTTIKDGAGIASLKIHCDYGSEQINCAVSGTHSASATLAQKMPYAFFPSAQAPTFDLAWASQMFIVQAERTIGQTTTIPVISIGDGERRNSIKLEVVETQQVEYLGREKIEVLHQEILAHKFRMKAPNAPKSGQDLWMSDSGLLLAITLDAADRKIMLTSYEGPPLTK
jgi:hypothetical protein